MEKGFKIGYAENAEVYVKNPDNWDDWLIQKTRNIKGHENLSKIAPDLPRTKTFWNEAKNSLHIFRFSKTLKEFYHVSHLYFARLYLYKKAFKELKKEEVYTDGWREQETPSTKTLD